MPRPNRYQDVFIGNRGYGRGAAENTLRLDQAGTHQFAPDLANLAANTPYIRRNVIPFLIEAPRFFRYTNAPELMVRCLKALLENHTRTIEGLDQAISVESAEAPVGGSGERIQTATNITRAVSNPNHGMWELQGRAVSKFIRWWITMGIGDINTKTPLVVANGNIAARDYDATFYGATVLYVEPDPTMTEVVSAWLCTNMYPTGTGPWEGSKDAGQLGQQLDMNLEFTALTDASVAVDLFAKQILRSLNLRGMNPNESPLWLEDVSADVKKAAMGIKDQLEQGANNRVVY